MSHFDRRSLLGYSMLGAGAALWPAMARAAAWSPYAAHGPDRVIIDDTSAVAQTESGKVTGYIRNDIKIFQGIPYGEILSPEARWVRAIKPKPWTGTRSARMQGPVCPPDTLYQVDPGMKGRAWEEWGLRESDALFWRPGEDCLRVNVYTPGTDDKKRQVLFWCHGGGFHNGSPVMTSRYEPHNLAKYGDVVFVSVTHRLNALGFLNLTAYGARYADSANLGMLDMIDALKWVQRNIGSFGGDPAKVTIMGQSGGASKVVALLAMPEAKPLFNRAVAMSAGSLTFSAPEQSAALTAAYLKQLGVAPGNIEALHKIPAEKLALAAGDVSANASARREEGESVPGWQPTVDGRSMLYHPQNPTMASDVPLIIGNTANENYIALGFPEYMTMKEPQARELVRVLLGPAGDGMYDVYARAFPKATPFEVSSMTRVAGRFRAPCVQLAQHRAAQGSAPTYNYWFQWHANTFEGRAMSHHELEIPLIFLTSDAVPTVTGASPEARALSLKMAESWLSFARTGDPNIQALPHWSPVMPGAVTSMVLDNDCRVDHGSDLAALEIYWKSKSSKG